MNQNKTESRSSSEITFKPITEGLGFHPFSDGLPYAPISKSPQKGIQKSTVKGGQSLASSMMGDGAVAAGPSRMASRAAQISVPIVQQTFNFDSALSASRASASSSSANQKAHLTYSRYYFLKRFFAYFLDSVLAGTVCLSGLSALVIVNDLNLDVLLDPSLLLLTALFVMMMNWLFMTLQEICFGNTLGKRCFGLSLGGKKRFRLLRALLFVPSMGFLGLGLWYGFFDRKKRCWHDRLADLQPKEVSHL